MAAEVAVMDRARKHPREPAQVSRPNLSNIRSPFRMRNQLATRATRHAAPVPPRKQLAPRAAPRAIPAPPRNHLATRAAARVAPVLKKKPGKVKLPKASRAHHIFKIDQRNRRSPTVLYKLKRKQKQKEPNAKKVFAGVQKKGKTDVTRRKTKTGADFRQGRSRKTRNYKRELYKAKVKRLNARMVKKNDSGKPRGKMSAYAFFLQTYREELKQRNPNESVNFAEFSKKCAEKWKNMGDAQKKRYNDMAAQDKNRHAQEMAHYQPPPGEGGIKRKRGKKDPNAPKRALSAFFWFCSDERANAKASLNNTNSVAQVAKELGRRWALVRPEQRARYEALAAKDKERYGKEQNVYKSSGGAGSSAKVAAAARVAPAQMAMQHGGSDEDDEDDDEEDDE